MAKRTDRVPRSAAECAARGTLAVGALLLGYGSVAQTVGYALRVANPAGAHRFAPDDGRVTGLFAQSLVGEDVATADWRRAGDVARQALRQDSTAVAAVSTLGLGAQFRGDVAGARRLFAYAQQLSRRELRTQVWAVEDAVLRGDVSGALRHYDIALRTSPEASDLLFPILLAATSDPAIRNALVRTLALQPLWTQSFLEYAANHRADPLSRAQLFYALGRKGVPISDNAHAATINDLVGDGLYEKAWTYYAAVRPGVDRRASRDAGFVATLAQPSAFDWTPAEGPGVSVRLGGGMADVASTGATGGTALRQLQLLPAGTYRLVGHLVSSDATGRTPAYWALTCLSGAELGRIPTTASARDTFSGQFTVPKGCVAQYLSLVLQPEGVSATSIGIDRINLAPMR